MAQLSSFAPSTKLSNYPFFSRHVVENSDLAKTFHDFLIYQSNGELGWTDVAVVAEVADYYLDFARAFIELAPEEFQILAYRTFLFEETNYDLDLHAIKDSGARVIMAAVSNNFPAFFARADELGLVGDSYVWLIPSVTSSISFYTPIPRAVGVLSAIGIFPEVPAKKCLTEAWVNADRVKYPFTGIIPLPPPITASLPFDSIAITSMAIKELDKKELLDGRRISAELWTSTIRNQTFDGLSGFISFDDKGNRANPITSVAYYNPQQLKFIPAFTRSVGAITPIDGVEIIWSSNTTKIPDLDIRESF
eukprot:CAMPEP_0117001994 /NCGR_PEP_ID=MMETSP0472-20121206/3811_1 /TAXON_ID=693140 ORGANISM="Tiarina fusus, Strain LIS" /NCGR_SAMPLE_ID=MMETSP0472 /ASSEMBLY_ACC=CAM_ASM_000603 /LENGTH=306 /DNA_ID=CAMNT_0004702193 /DNA_START=436 /DNA_END=1353 /DNA_ORIENTATION=+